MDSIGNGYEKATLGGGCFWCTEAMYKMLKGVVKVESGYAGGELKNPTYKEISGGLTGHAEVVQVTFDPDVISYEDIIEAFWRAHDPTTLNRQGNDIGTQYRSIILYENESQKIIAQASLAAAEEAGLYSGIFTTEFSPLTEFYPAETYHQNYYANNPNQPYCTIVTKPKVDKFRRLLKDKLKPTGSSN
jgi:peptide-methionine (S)-S-oxide reductase